MKVAAFMNKQGGTLRTADHAALAGVLESEFRVHGHEIEVKFLTAEDLGEALKGAAERTDLDVVLVGGGDGSVSSAAGTLYGSPVALGILPAGTLNLYARTLQVPLGLNEAAAALAAGRIVDVDIATVNGRPFVHQFAVGLHARMVRMRRRMSYGSRFGKIIASFRSAVMALQSAPKIELEIAVDGQARRIRTPAVAISNNMYGEGHMPYADDPAGGTLGVYICKTDDRRALMKLAADIVLGTWRTNPSLEVFQAQEVVLRYGGHKRHGRAVRDGELEDLSPQSEIRIEKRRLKVLAPHDASYLPD
jgi:diacylglycerol kinase family enzyme